MANIDVHLIARVLKSDVLL